ncbi:MAG: prepilin-type N-terminal cleavage/methylation domain-containing protein [Fimbriimonadaceae bacterium]
MKNHQTVRRSKSAFTLIELLVVIAIIAILAAILFPVFAQARSAALQTQSLSSVKQIGTSSILYTDAYDQQQWPRWYSFNEPSLAYTMQELLEPYVKSTDVWINPAMSRNVNTFDPTNACPRASQPNIVAHYLTMTWAPFNYWDWFGTIMMGGFPTPALPTTVLADGGTCTPSWLASRPWARCASFPAADEPSRTAVIIPGAMIAYQRPAPAPDAKLKFGAACMAVTGPCHANSSCAAADIQQSKQIQVFRDGSNYGFADTSARWLSTTNFNANNSATWNFQGTIYPANPWTRVRSN